MKYIFILIFITNFCHGQPPQIQWQKCYGGTAQETATGLVQTFDGGYIIAGASASNDGDVSGNHGPSYGDIWIVKIDPTGSIEWQQCYGGSGGESANSIVQTVDSGFIFTGITGSNDGDVSGNHGPTFADLWVVKINKFGLIQWQKCYGGSRGEVGYSINKTFDGGFIITGSTLSNDGDVSGNHDTTGGDPDIWVIKIDEMGILEWQKCLGGIAEEVGNAVIQTIDSGYAIVGWEQEPFDNGDVVGSHGDRDVWIVKLSITGSVEWQKCLGGSFVEEGYSIVQTIDQDYILAGTAGSNDGDVTGLHGSLDFWIVKLDTSGNLLWQKCYGGSYGEQVSSIKMTRDGGFVCVGLTVSFDGDVSGNHGDSIPPFNYLDYWVLKIDSLGILQWEHCYGGSQDEYAYCIEVTNDSGYICCGFAYSNDFDVSLNHGNGDMWIVKLAPESNYIKHTDTPIHDFNLYLDSETNNLYLNYYTSTNEDYILQFIDIFGKVLCERMIKSRIGFNQHEMQIGNIVSGTYVVRLGNKKGFLSKKLIL